MRVQKFRTTRNILLFLILNFSGLAIGSLFTTGGVSSSWYENLNKAPWTPPGWVFGVAWTLIMVCFTIYMALLLKDPKTHFKVIYLYILQWLLNALWNPTFFYYQSESIGLIVITLLTLLIGFFFFTFLKNLKIYSLLIAPYLIWLLIATSLNAYILIYN